MASVMAMAILTVTITMMIMVAAVTAHPFSRGGGGGGGGRGGGLSLGYYARTCPKVMDVIRQGVQEAMQKETRMGASLLRLSFHDCFVQGCDASLLLDDNSAKGIVSEKNSNPNKNSARGFQVLDTIKSRLEQACPATVSCADILAVAARDAVVLSGGLGWDVPLGRRDSKTASLSGSNNNIPPPNSTLQTLVSKFKAQGLNEVDLVALSGSHTIGKSRCTSFRQRVYNRTSYIQQSFYQKLTSNCPLSGGDNRLSPLDFQTPTRFDGSYFSNLLKGMGVLHSDEVLSTGDAGASKQVAQRIANLVRQYAKNEQAFLRQFAESMVKMGNVSPLLSPNGEVRRSCRSPN